MKSNPQSKGTWWQRLVIRTLTLSLSVLIYWLLGFLVGDIRTLDGPDYNAIEASFVDEQLTQRADTLKLQIADLDRRIGNESEKQRVVGDGSRSLQQTITQLLELQKLGLENNVAFSAAEQENLTSTLNLFLENQRQYQESSQSSAELLNQKQGLVSQLDDTQKQLEQQRAPARDAYRDQVDEHRLKLAFWQLAMLLPVLGVATTLLVKKRNSIYFPLFLALGFATLFKVGLVVHEYFPSRYFKYILIGALLVVVGKMLIHFIRGIAFPKTEWLINQYREAYERFLCPICEYPIRTGPRKYLFWTRRSVTKLKVTGDASNKEEAYTCPACGTGLFDKCSNCQNVRHSLLPHCSHCGQASSIEDQGSGK